MRIILYVFLFVLLIIYSWVQIYDGDIGHHIKAGEWMLAEGKVLDRDIFSYTAYGNSWLNHSWLSEIILYYIYWLAGINGLVFFKIISLVLCYVFLVKSCYLLIEERNLINDIIIAVLFIMSVLTASPRFIVRPLIFTFLGVSLCIYLFAKARKDMNCLFFIPLLLLFWVNLHAEFILGVIMLILFWLCNIFPFRIKKFQKASIIAGLSLLALFVTPYGVKLFIHPLSLTTSDLFMTRISEWLPPMHPVFRKEIFVKVFYGFFGIGLLSFILNFRRKNILFFLFFIVIAIMSFSSIRFMPYFSMLGIPIVAENAVRIRKRIWDKIYPVLSAGRNLSAARRRRLKVIFERSAAIAAIIFSVFLIERRTHYTEFGFGLAERVCYPLNAGRFLESSGVGGNVFNMCDFGGYLIWYHPRHPVFVDGRLDVYGEKIYEEFLSPGEETFQKYNIDYIFLSFRHPATRTLLYKNDKWPLVYWDDIALIYVKNSRENKDLIDRYGYKYIHPLTGSYSFLEKADAGLKSRVWKEIHQAIRISPDSIRAHVVLGDIYVELKDFKNAIHAYEDAIHIGKNYYTPYMIKVYHNLAKLYHNLNEYSKAEWYYRRVLNLARPGETIYDRALEDRAHLAYTQGNKKKAFRLVKEAVKYKSRSKGSILSGYPTSLATLAILYEDLGKKDKAVIAWQEVYETGWGDCRKQAIEHLQQLRGKE